MKFFIKWPITLYRMAFLSGCAFTKENFPLNYRLDANSSDVLKVSRIEKISVSAQDKRDIEDPRLIIHKRNRYRNITSGGYLAEKPIVNIVKEGLSTGLKQMGYHLTGNSKYLFDCELMELEPKHVMGWAHGKFGIQIELNIHVYNKARHTFVWQDMMKGRGSVTTSLASNDDILRIALSKALTNAIRQLQSAQSLITALKLEDERYTVLSSKKEVCILK